MAEAPPPPPNLVYNSFRTWRKNNSLSNAQPALSDAWKEYKDIYGNIKTVSSPKKSPKPSPKIRISPPKTEMHRIVAPALTMLPPGIGELITRNLPAKSLAMLQVTSKKTKAITQAQIVALCNELPTHKEVVAGVRSMLVTPEAQLIGYFLYDDAKVYYRMGIVSPKEVAFRSIYAYTETAMVAPSKYMYSSLLDKFESVLPDFGTVDPITILKTLQRRQGCRKEGYGLNIVVQFITGFLRPLFQPFVLEEQIDRILSTEPYDIEGIILPPAPDRDNVDYWNYIRNARRLFLASYWLVSYRNNLPEVAIIASLINDELDASWWAKTLNNTLMFFTRLHFETNRPPSTLTTNQVDSYIRKHIENKQPFVISFFNMESKVGKSESLSRVIRITFDGRRSTYRIYEVSHGINHETMKMIPVTIDYAGSTVLTSGISNSMLGIVDPITARAIVGDSGQLNNDWIRNILPAYFETLLLPFFRYKDSVNLATIEKIASQISAAYFPTLASIAVWCGATPEEVWDPLYGHNIWPLYGHNVRQEEEQRAKRYKPMAVQAIKIILDAQALIY